MNKSEIINKWQIDIANCEQIINHCSVTEKTLEFTKGEKNAISECLKDIKNLNEATVKRERLIDFFNMIKPRASELAERNTEDVVDFYLQKSIK